MTILALEGVGHAFPGGAALFRDVDAELRAGEVYALTGPSGSGKSTLLSIMAGWVPPLEGRVVRHGVGKVAWVFQNPHGVARRTALDHVVLPYLAQGLRRREGEARAREQLESFGLAPVADHDFATLSGGEAQRLMLARGIACSPDLLLVDEPTAQLDRRTAEVVNSTLHALRVTGTIVVVATHDPVTRSLCTGMLDLGAFR